MRETEGVWELAFARIHLVIVSNKANRTTAVPVRSLLAITSLHLSRYSVFTPTQFFSPSGSIAHAVLKHTQAAFDLLPFATGTLSKRVIPSRNHDQALNYSSIKLPLLQPTPMTLFRHLLARHLDIRRLHVLLRQLCADFLVRLGVGLFAVARAVEHAFACDAWLETRAVRVGRGFWGGAFCAGWCRSCGSLWDDGAWA
jgi:hypothetical protein